MIEISLNAITVKYYRGTVSYLSYTNDLVQYYREIGSWEAKLRLPTRFNDTGSLLFVLLIVILIVVLQVSSHWLYHLMVVIPNHMSNLMLLAVDESYHRTPRGSGSWETMCFSLNPWSATHQRYYQPKSATPSAY